MEPTTSKRKRKAINLTDAKIGNLKLPASGYDIVMDSSTRGGARLGIRLSYTGSRVFILDYGNADGRRRRMVLGEFGNDMGINEAREEASKLATVIKKGGDPLAAKRASKQAIKDRWTVADLADDYLREHADVHKQPASAKADRMMLRKYILPRIGEMAVADVATVDLEQIINAIAREGHRVPANRTRALLSIMFNRAITLKLRPPADNPIRGVRKFVEQPRQRYLTADETAALMRELRAEPNQRAANVIRLLYYTGARRGELLTAKWSEFDLVRGVWTKPSAHTKQKRTHTTPLNSTALTLLREMRASVHPDAEMLFAQSSIRQPQSVIQRVWLAVCARAGIEDLHLHDLHHSFASALLARGVGLEVIGGLLGHTKVATTQRYAHLVDSTMREATERLVMAPPAIAGAGK